MAHAKKPDFVFRRNGRVHLNRRGASVQSTTDSRGVRISGSNAGCTMFWGSVKGAGYPLHSPVSPSLPLPCVTVCHHISTGVYHIGRDISDATATGKSRLGVPGRDKRFFLSFVTPTTVLGPNMPPTQLAQAALFPAKKRSRREAIYWSPSCDRATNENPH